MDKLVQLETEFANKASKLKETGDVVIGDVRTTHLLHNLCE